MKNKTLESIFKDIDVLGINGGYSVEQLLSPQDCRMLKLTIKDLQERIDNVVEYIEENIDNGNELVFTQKGKWTTFQFKADNIILEILKGER